MSYLIIVVISTRQITPFKRISSINEAKKKVCETISNYFDTTCQDLLKSSSLCPHLKDSRIRRYVLRDALWLIKFRLLQLPYRKQLFFGRASDSILATALTYPLPLPFHFRPPFLSCNGVLCFSAVVTR